MTDEENEQNSKLEVTASSDVAKDHADAKTEDADKKTEPLNATEGTTNELPKSELIQEEGSVNNHRPEPASRTFGGIGPSEHTYEPETNTSEETESSGDSETIDVESSDGAESSELPVEYTDAPADKNKSTPKIQRVKNISSGNPKDAINGMMSFFTIKKQDVGQKEMDAMENNFHFVPVIGAMFGIVLMIEMIFLFLLNYYFIFPLGPVIAITALGTVLIGSKFLHFDGLVDFGDGMVASGDQKKHVTALKDTSVGAGGIGLALVVMLATLAIYSIAGGWGDPMFYALFFIIPATEILIKNAMVCAAATGTPGNGMASKQVEKADTDTMFKSTGLSAFLLIIGLIMATAVIWVMNKVHVHYGGFPLIGNFAFYVTALFIAIVIGLVVSMIVGIMMSKIADRTFGVTNGDILGATNEIARPIISSAMLLFFLIFIRILTRI